MKIIILTCKNPIDNSGVLVFDWYKSLKNAGHTVAILSQYYDRRLDDHMYSVYGRFSSAVKRRIHKIKHRFYEKKITDANYCMHSLNERENYVPFSRIKEKLPFIPDLFVYIFPHSFLNARNLFELNHKLGVPICVAPVDLAELTGGCHYTNGCDGYERNCGSCPGMYSTHINDQTYNNLVFKKKYISQTDLFTVSNTWTSDFIRKSSIYKGKPTYTANVVVNENSYLPGDKENAKKHFNIPDSMNVVFFGANYIEEKRKGFSFLVDALNMLYLELEKLKRDHVCIAIAGRCSIEIQNSIPFKVYSLGHLTHSQLCYAFQMSDVFVSPSIQDAGPMMVIQSMMCGTPVVAFEMGNSVDFIVDSVTGFQAKLYDTSGLKTGICNFLSLSNEAKLLVSKNCRELAVNKSSYKVFAQNFAEIVDDFKNNTRY